MRLTRMEQFWKVEARGKQGQKHSCINLCVHPDHGRTGNLLRIVTAVAEIKRIILFYTSSDAGIRNTGSFIKRGQTVKAAEKETLTNHVDKDCMQEFFVCKKGSCSIKTERSGKEIKKKKNSYRQCF
ncbi:hypothetical protein CEXT_530421 [Caerostris extrusa]|uniref:Uncharacterized protein n=1 Tax=Caerostris extrusa TaxID=172846 RepID=A0AAV4QSC7_CAEEX|nr:hypothetical protein CEXT_530421 [Caerostris extrusa]